MSDRDRDLRAGRKIAKSIAATLTLAIAVLGAITGTMAWRENRQISLDVSASTYAAFVSLGKFGMSGSQVRVSIVNSSSRAVTLTAGRVQYVNTEVGTVRALALDEHGSPEQPNDVPVELPYTVPAGTSVRLRLDWSPPTSVTQLLTSALKVPVAKRIVTLQLRFEPGGTRTVRVRTGQVANIVSGWRTTLVLERNVVRSLIMVPVSASTPPTVDTLDVWSANASGEAPMLTLSRPGAAQLGMKFSLASLPPGSYVYSLSDGQRTVAAGAFRTPCVGRDGAYTTPVCAKAVAGKAPAVDKGR